RTLLFHVHLENVEGGTLLYAWARGGGRREFDLDRPAQVPSDPSDDLGELNGPGDVVNEVDQKREVDEEQSEGDGQRQVGHELPAYPGGDRAEREDRV